jgi:hypothetical protein
MIREALMTAMMNASKGGNNSEQVVLNEEESNTTDSPDLKKLKTDWNDFLSWMDKKNVRGKPELNTGDLGNKYFRQYIKENPNTSLSESSIPLIRAEYGKLRDYNIAQIRAGKSGMSIGGKVLYGKEAEAHIPNFMSGWQQNEKSANPNYVGQYLTQTPFPSAFLEVRENDKVVERKSVPTYSIEEREELYKTKKQKQ